MSLDFLSPEYQQMLANIIVLVITGVVGAITKAVYTFIKTKTSAEQFSLLEVIAASAVSAAEQGAIAGFVKDRKATAIAVVNEALKNAGVTNLTAEQIDAAIEAAVKDGLNYNKQVNDVPAGTSFDAPAGPEPIADVLEGA